MIFIFPYQSDFPNTSAPKFSMVVPTEPTGVRTITSILLSLTYNQWQTLPGLLTCKKTLVFLWFRLIIRADSEDKIYNNLQAIILCGSALKWIEACCTKKVMKIYVIFDNSLLPFYKNGGKLLLHFLFEDCYYLFTQKKWERYLK